MGLYNCVTIDLQVGSSPTRSERAGHAQICAYPAYHAFINIISRLAAFFQFSTPTWVHCNLRVNFRTRAQRVPGTRDHHTGLTNGTPRVPGTLPKKHRINSTPVIQNLLRLPFRRGFRWQTPVLTGGVPTFFRNWRFTPTG